MTETGSAHQEDPSKTAFSMGNEFHEAPTEVDSLLNSSEAQAVSLAIDELAAQRQALLDAHPEVTPKQWFNSYTGVTEDKKLLTIHRLGHQIGDFIGLSDIGGLVQGESAILSPLVGRISVIMNGEGSFMANTQYGKISGQYIFPVTKIPEGAIPRLRLEGIPVTNIANIPLPPAVVS